MNNIKLALLCNGYGLVNRGAEQFTYQFYQHLKDTFDIDIYGIGTTDHSIKIPSRTRDNFFIPWRNGKAYLESYFFCKKFYKKMIKEKREYDLIFNNAGFSGSYWCHKYKKKTNIPYITRARGGGNEEKINCLFSPDCIVFLTKENERSTTKFFPSITTKVIPNAIDVDEYKIDKKMKQSPLLKGLEKPIFLGTSAFVEYKRTDLIIDAVSQCEKGSLLLVGDGILKDKIVANGKETLKTRFRYGGVIPRSKRKEIIRIYNQADVFVQAARKEAFGVVFLEAMAAGLPVVTQRDERREEIIGDAGILVDCTDINEFSNALTTAAKKKWGNIPMNQAKKYDWKKIRDEYISLIETIVERRKK